MSKKTTTYSVTLANAASGAVHGHKAGCADLKRSKQYAMHRDEQFTVEVESKREAWLDYNADFIAEGGEDNAYPVEWFACAKHVPEGGAEQSERCAKHPAFDADYCPSCGTATPISERTPKQPAKAASRADKAAAAEFTGEPATEAEKAADAIKDWRGNYNTVFAPAAEVLAASEKVGAEAWTVNVSTMLKETRIAGPKADALLRVLVEIEADAIAAMKEWQRTLDRKDMTDMEKFNQNRSFLSGYLAAVAQEKSHAKKMPVIAFAKDMDKALRPDALKAGAAARKSA